MSNNQSSRAKALYDQLIEEDGLAILLSYPIEQKAEDEILEFKSAKTPDNLLSAKLSKALGAFANNAGGVLVWGIEASGDGISPDVANSAEPSANAVELKDKLMQRYPTATDPHLKGVLIESVFTNAAKDEGFVICYIPAGDDKPYESKVSKDGRAVIPYYIRIGGTSQPMPRSLLKQAFNPALSTKASIVITAEWKKDYALNDLIEFYCIITNIGKQTIREAFFFLQCDLKLEYVTVNNGEPILEHEVTSSYIKLKAHIHPEMQNTISILTKRGTFDEADFGLKIFEDNQPAKAIEFSYNLRRNRFIFKKEAVPAIQAMLEDVS